MYVAASFLGAHVSGICVMFVLGITLSYGVVFLLSDTIFIYCTCQPEGEATLYIHHMKNRIPSLKTLNLLLNQISSPTTIYQIIYLIKIAMYSNTII